MLRYGHGRAAVPREPDAALAFAFRVDVAGAVCTDALERKIGTYLRGVFSLLTVDVRQGDGVLSVVYRERWGLSSFEARINRILVDAETTGVSLMGFACASMASFDIGFSNMRVASTRGQTGAIVMDD
ncbi:hypothetical protein [Janthinobacterium fluminis]|uniref:Uncharacterized protein n=1 Tax=Janthinobacterium fluminis TaxID=2987524 RepID=A0ABT5JWI6_9BURK|nr:hypothetical protein [Janthinobacterium fluminis]MDC8757104.1 hypothetical protein [Janthinobacterium fluminis]